LQSRTDALEAKERTAERRARQQARDILLAARSEVESAIRDLRATVAIAESEQDREAAIRLARRRVEDRASVQARRVRKGTAEERDRAGVTTVAEGDRVRIESTGATGTVVELRDDRAMVDVGGVRLHVSAGGLVPANEAPAQSKSRSPVVSRTGWSGPDFDASSEVDLRGLRADEAVSRLQPALDAAIQAALPSLRIIHGKGTGALREVVVDQLQADKRVASFRPGGIGEGGTGVTVAELR
jgi:DNA mismatch repair protein MutS2